MNNAEIREAIRSIAVICEAVQVLQGLAIITLTQVTGIPVIPGTEEEYHDRALGDPWNRTTTEKYRDRFKNGPEIFTHMLGAEPFEVTSRERIRDGKVETAVVDPDSLAITGWVPEGQVTAAYLARYAGEIVERLLSMLPLSTRQLRA